MEGFSTLYGDMKDWLSRPFSRDMPISQILLVFILFLIVAFIVYDMLAILKSWMESATEVVSEAIS